MNRRPMKRRGRRRWACPAFEASTPAGTAAAAAAVALGCLVCCYSCCNASGFQASEGGVFRVIDITSNMAESGGHVIGDMSAEIQVAPGADVQVQWSVVISSSEPTIAKDEVQVSSNDNEIAKKRQTAPNNDTDFLYTVPIVGDSWCSAEDITWNEPPHKRLSSTITCLHLPTDVHHQHPMILLSLRASNDAVQLNHLLSPHRTPGLDVLRHGSTIFPITCHERVRHFRLGDSLRFNFSAETRSNETILKVKVGWSDEAESVSSSNNFGFLRTGIVLDRNYTRGNMTFIRTRSIQSSGAVLHSVVLSFVDARPEVQGTYWVLLSAGSDNTETLRFTTSLVLVNPGGPSPSPPDDQPSTHLRFRLQSCSGGETTSLRQRTTFHFRSGIADCVYCLAVGWPVSRLQLERAGGGQLGTEESHSIYWYRESYLSSTIVFVVRSPSHKYSGDYVCSAERLRTTQAPCEAGQPDCQHVAKFSIRID